MTDYQKYLQLLSLCPEKPSKYKAESMENLTWRAVKAYRAKRKHVSRVEAGRFRKAYIDKQNKPLKKELGGDYWTGKFEFNGKSIRRRTDRSTIVFEVPITWKYERLENREGNLGDVLISKQLVTNIRIGDVYRIDYWNEAKKEVTTGWAVKPLKYPTLVKCTSVTNAQTVAKKILTEAMSALVG